MSIDSRDSRESRESRDNSKCRSWCTITDWCYACRQQGVQARKTMQYAEKKSRYNRRTLNLD